MVDKHSTTSHNKSILLSFIEKYFTQDLALQSRCPASVPCDLASSIKKILLKFNDTKRSFLLFWKLFLTFLYIVAYFFHFEFVFGYSR